MLHHLGQVMLVLAFFFGKGAEHAVGVADGGRLDPAPSSLGDASRRRRARIQGLEELGRSTGRRANADGFFYCDSNQSQVRWDLGNSRWCSASSSLVMVGDEDVD